MNKEEEWQPFTQEVLDSMTYGAYLLKDSEGIVLYIGQGEVIRRLQVHFHGQEKKKKRQDVDSFKIIWCSNRNEAEELERKLLDEHKRKHGDFPKYNKRN